MLPANSDPASFKIHGNRHDSPFLSACLAAADTAIENRAAAKMAKDIAAAVVPTDYDGIEKWLHQGTGLVQGILGDLKHWPLVQDARVRVYWSPCGPVWSVVMFHRDWRSDRIDDADRLRPGYGAAKTLREAAEQAHADMFKEHGAFKARARPQWRPDSDATQGTLPLVKLGQGTSATTITEGGV